jgi:hypothetical protein
MSCCFLLPGGSHLLLFLNYSIRKGLVCYIFSFCSFKIHLYEYWVEVKGKGLCDLMELF